MKLGNKVYEIPPVGTKFNFGYNHDKLFESLKPVSEMYPPKGLIKKRLNWVLNKSALEMYQCIRDTRIHPVMVFNALVRFGSNLRWATVVTPMMTICRDPIIEPHLIGLYYLARPYMLTSTTYQRALVMNAVYNCPAYVRHEHRILVHRPNCDDRTQFVRLIEFEKGDPF